MAAIEAVTINGLPLSVFEKSGISKPLSPMLDKLGLTLNRSNIRDLVIHQANILREQIAEEVTGKLISLKFDIASRKERGFLGINVQYVHGECLKIRTLGVKEMFQRHTGDAIKSYIMQVLDSYGIDIIQVYSNTTDNGTNMVKCGRLMYDEIEEVVNNENELENDEQNFLHEMMLEESITNEMSMLNINRCGAHTLALAIEDAINKDKEVKKTLDIARQVVKKLRAPNLMLKLKERRALKPILDVPTP